MTLFTDRDFDAEYVEPRAVRLASFCLRWFMYAMLGVAGILMAIAIMRGPG
jgi:hypothetical protein